MNKNKNLVAQKAPKAQKLKTNIYLDDFKVDNRIITLFKTPIILKKIQLLKKFKSNESIEIQRKLSVKIKPLNKKLVKYSKIISNYKIEINKMILNNIKIKKKNIDNSKFLFLEGGDLRKLKLYLNKLLWPYISSNMYNHNISYQNSIASFIQTDSNMSKSLKKNKKVRNKNGSFGLSDPFGDGEQSTFKKSKSFKELQKIGGFEPKNIVSYNFINNSNKKRNSNYLFSYFQNKTKTELISKLQNNLIYEKEKKRINFQKFYNSLYKPLFRTSSPNIIKDLAVKKDLPNLFYFLQANKELTYILFHDIVNKNKSITAPKERSKEIDGLNFDLWKDNLESNIQNKGAPSGRSENLNNNWYYWVSKTLDKNYNFKKFLIKSKLIKKNNIIKQKANINKDFVVRKPEKKIGLINSLSINPFSLWLRKVSISSSGSFNFYLPYVSSLNAKFDWLEVSNYNRNKSNNVNIDTSLHQLKLLSALRLIQVSMSLSNILPAPISVSLKKGKNGVVKRFIKNKSYRSKILKKNKLNLIYTSILNKKNYFKKIIEIRNLLVILKNMQEHIEFLIDLRRKLILKRRIKLIKKILAEQDIESEKENFKKRIDIFNINSSLLSSSLNSNTKQIYLDLDLEKKIERIKDDKMEKANDNKYVIFPAKDSFYNKEILVFKKDLELMLASCFDLFVFIKDDLSINDIYYKKNTNTKNDILPLQSASHISFNNQVPLINSNNEGAILSNLSSVYNQYPLVKKNEGVAAPSERAVKNKEEDKLYLKFLSSNYLTDKNKNIQKNNYKITTAQPLSFVDRGLVKGEVIREDIKIINNLSIKSVNNIKQSEKIETYSNLIKYAIEENKKKIVKAFKYMILKHKKFDPEISTVLNSSPVNVIYYLKNNKPILNHYLKSMSIYNMIVKGTFIYFSSCVAYFFKKKNYKKFKNIYKFLFYFFKTMFCLISKPVFVYKTDKIIIQLFYFLIIPNFFKNKILRKNFRYKKQMIKFKKGWIKRKPFKYWISKKTKKRVFIFNNNLKFNIRLALRKAYNVSLIDLYPNKFRLITNVLSKALKKNIELNLIRLHYPYQDSNIFANLLALLVNKIKIRRITRKLFKYAVIKNIKKIIFDSKSNYIPAFLTGMTIKIAGRLMKYKVIPRKTVQKIQKGSSSFGKVNFTDFARYNSKNRRGAFSITVSSGQNFF